MAASGRFMAPIDAADDVQLRNVLPSDLDVLFLHQADELANRMAAFTADDPSDKIAFQRHWEQNLSDTNNRIRTIVWRGEVAGYVSSFELLGKPSIAYWVGRDFWGRGIATAAVKQFLHIVPERPLFARVAADNLGSIRVLEKCGFVRAGTERSYATGRRSEIDELIFRLGEP